MHQPDTTPRRSVYHRYRVHPAAPMADGDHAPVVVVGAGPIGLVLALDLAQRGLRCVLLEAEQQVSEGSRAIVFTRRSMEILQQVGVADAITARGLPWRFGTSHYRGRPVFRMEAPHDEHDRFQPMINLQQQVLEELLLERAAQTPGVQLRWGHKVVGLASDEQGATLQVDTPQGPYTQRADWVVACDGARSTRAAAAGPADAGRQLRRPLRHRRHPHRAAAAHRTAGLLRPAVEPRQHGADAPRAAGHLAHRLPAAGR
jgi:3-(3-hydroxy-phenyl)propionate hydroxylase